jgi:hypothetical protein
MLHLAAPYPLLLFPPEWFRFRRAASCHVQPCAALTLPLLACCWQVRTGSCTASKRRRTGDSNDGASAATIAAAPGVARRLAAAAAATRQQEAASQQSRAHITVAAETAHASISICQSTTLSFQPPATRPRQQQPRPSTATRRPDIKSPRPAKPYAAPRHAIADTVAAHASASAPHIQPQNRPVAKPTAAQADAAAASAGGNGGSGHGRSGGTCWRQQEAAASTHSSYDTNCSIDSSSSTADDSEDVDGGSVRDCLGERRMVSLDGGCSSIFAGSTPYDVCLVYPPAVL